MSKENSKSPFTEQHQQKVDELVSIAKDQGYITYEEINEILPMTFDSADQIDQVLIYLEWDGHPSFESNGSRKAKRA